MKDCETWIGDDEVKMPHNFVTSSETLTVAYTMYKILAKEHGEPEDTYKVLADGLPKLRNLEKVAVQTQIDRSGLNDDRYYYSKDYQDNGKVAYSESVDGYERLAYRALENCRATRNAGALFKALRDANIVVRELSFGNGLADRLPYYLTGHISGLPSADALNHLAANLRCLALSIGDHPFHKDSVDWRKFIAAAVQLESLHFYPHCCHEYDDDDDDIWHDAQEFGSTSSLILPHARFPNLRTIKIIGKLDKPAKIRAVWLNALLDRHPSIRNVELSGVLIVNWYDSETVADTMATCLRRLRRSRTLRSAKALLHRRVAEHEENSSKKSPGFANECEKRCCQYQVLDSTWIPVSDMDELAHALDVQLKKGVWDFGDFLMRR